MLPTPTAERDIMKSPTRDTGILTVAAIRRPKGSKAVQYLFNERQRIFTLPSGARSSIAIANRLKNSLRKKAPVVVSLDPRRGRILKAEEPSEHAVREFRRLRALLEKPSRPVRLDVARIDPTLFNIVDLYLKWPPFRLCWNVIPNYAKAKEIFDFCAKQSCNLPGPYDISPCIPFQYVIDGCYARAHKMRWIITTKYRYCCEKVFAFANQNNDTLAVKADKWGGCCVFWWYHVAPLVRVRVTLTVPVDVLPFPRRRKIASKRARTIRLSLVLAMVIDPGMFDKPVLLSTWLSAVATKACAANANVSMYSIQPGSAYSPANYQGTQFATDDTYAQTNATLINYRNLTTCP